jgi:carbohydrate kinase (thermoresistant glucokinase family)
VVLVLMGVSGVGKTTVGRLVAAATGARFLDADDLHPPENVAKLAAGTPLSDADRTPWYLRIGRALDDARAEGAPVVLACSALRRANRESLQAGRPEVVFVVLSAPRELVRARLETRRGHFMPAVLLDSQFVALEMPGDAVVVDATASAETVAAAVLRRLGLASSGPDQSGR